MKIFAAGSAYFTREVCEGAKNLGYEIVPLAADKVHCSCDEAEIDVIVCSGLFELVDVEKYTKLKLLQLTTAGFDLVPVDFLQSRGVRVKNARGAFSAPMAEFALCGVLQFYKKSRYFEENRKKRIFKRSYELLELSGKTVCIVGAGSVGSECARRFSAMGCRVLGIDLNTAPTVFFDEIRAVCEMKKTFSESDIIIACLPLCEQSRKLIGKAELEAMGSGTVFVNLARGGIVDEAALIEALREKRIFGAVLDVTENEPLEVESPLWDMENVILTPHTSFAGDGNRVRIGNMILESLEELAAQNK